MDALHMVELFQEVGATIATKIATLADWGLSGNRAGQYTIDVSADAAGVAALTAAGLGVLSEESGLTAADSDVLVVMDPIDGSTNASAGLPWYATSLCALDAGGPLVSYVVNQATGDRWHAIRGEGAFKNDVAIRPSSVSHLGDALLAVSGLPTRHLGWGQFRCYGAAALDLCAVADGTFDAFADLSVDAHGGWDYLGALLVCTEAGAPIVDVKGRDLVVRAHSDRRTPVAAATPALLDELLNAVNADKSAT